LGTVINVVVTATKRRRKPVPAALQFRQLKETDCRKAVTEWVSRLADSDAELTTAGELYAGDQWQIARSLPDRAKKAGWKVRLWVCSSGYGLISPKASIHPYSANYSTTHLDYVVRGSKPNRFRYLQDWWSRLAKWPGPEPGQPRTIEAIAQQCPKSPLVLVASDTIIKVLEPDLLCATQRLADPNHLLLVSGGIKPSEKLQPYALPFNARLQGLLGGSRMSLNVRTINYLLQTHVTNNLRSTWTNKLLELTQRAPEIKRYDRTAMSDEAVIRFILESLRAEPTVAWSSLLRRLRDSGYRCEQKRFAKLFKHTAPDE